MNTSPLHPLVVHVPMALAALMPFVALGLAVAWWKGWLQRRAWWVAVGLQLAMAVGAFASLRTGDGEEDVAKKVLSGGLIHAHEEAAEAFTVGAVLVLVLALGAALLPRERTAKAVAVAAAAGTLAVLGLGVRTGSAGGELVYKYNAGAAWSQAAAGGGGPPAVDGGVAPAGEAAGAAGAGENEEEHGSDKD